MSLSRDSWDSVQLLTLCTRRSFSESRSVLLIPGTRINETIQWMPCQAKFSPTILAPLISRPRAFSINYLAFTIDMGCRSMILKGYNGHHT